MTAREDAWPCALAWELQGGQAGYQGALGVALGWIKPELREWRRWRRPIREQPSPAALTLQAGGNNETC